MESVTDAHHASRHVSSSSKCRKTRRTQTVKPPRPESQRKQVAARSRAHKPGRRPPQQTRPSIPGRLSVRDSVQLGFGQAVRVFCHVHPAAVLMHVRVLQFVSHPAVGVEPDDEPSFQA